MNITFVLKNGKKIKSLKGIKIKKEDFKELYTILEIEGRK